MIYVTRITGDWDVWSLRPGDGTRQQLTQNSGDFNENPSVTADGKFIFFSSNRSGSKHIWRMDINGENQTQVTFGEKEIEMCPAVSPDGNWLYYLQKSAKYSAVWRKSLTNGKAERLTEQGKLSPDNFLYLSPDGGSLAFQNLTEKINETPEKQILQIAIISTEKKFEHQFFNVATSRPLVHWARDGTAFEYLENTKKRRGDLATKSR